MKVISVWAPWAYLLVYGHKTIETRSWPAPKAVVGTRIGIAATKNVTAIERAAVAEPEFQRFYAETGLPPVADLPRGCVVGSAVLHTCDPMDQALVDGITHEEFVFGEYAIGRWAWRMRAQQVFGPYYARGMQGLWEWPEPPDLAAGNQDNARPDGQPMFPGRKVTS